VSVKQAYGFNVDYMVINSWINLQMAEK